MHNTNNKIENIFNFKKHYYYIIIILLSLPLFINKVHLFDWDEVNFAEIAREMIITKNYFNVQLNYQPFWEKPPLFFWLQAISMQIFGINEFASRFPNTLVGITTFFTLLYFGNKKIKKDFGIVWAITFMGTMLPYFYFKTAIIDPLFNLFIYLSLFNLFIYSNTYSIKKIVYAGLFCGLAFLTKGPVAILIIGLVSIIYLIYIKFNFKIKVIHIITFLIVLLTLASIWILPELLKEGGITLFKDFIAYQIRLFNSSEAGHGQPFYYHPIVLFIGCFPISQLIIFSIFKIKNKNLTNQLPKDFYALNFILFWVVLILFSITTTKIVHYSSLCYLPLSFITAINIYYLIINKEVFSKKQIILMQIMTIILGAVFILFPLVVNFKQYIIPYINDTFARENILQNVYWNKFEFLNGVLFIVIALFLINRIKKSTKYILDLFLFVIIFINLLLYTIVPKLEQHIQKPMIDFFESHKNEYITTYNFRSYAQYFYSSKMPQQNNNSYNTNWLLNGEIDKPVYIVSKIFNKQNVLELNNIEYLYEKGGFVFFVRKPKIK